MSNKIVELDLLELIFAIYENGMIFETIVDVVDFYISPVMLQYIYRKTFTYGI